MLKHIADFILSEWLWNITWDWYHIPLSFLFMTLLLRIMMRINIIPAVLISFCVQLYTFGVHIGLIGFLIYVLDVPFDPAALAGLQTSLSACFNVALVNVLLQGLFFLILNMFYKLNFGLAITVVVLSNMLSAYISNLLLPVPLM